ncbi:hypothetical protein KHC28_06145 [Ancylobacter sonchi]|uniref:hypothetical protein n=1 Tax=Ancylobacter sonchi TaxID=1937790 RepID=UPI001BD5921A|nr:hypothetical protein [Ancylobacter sonchi]MBS7533237.1 hypothetical protein [Ancylobacter sonchi]
MTPKRLAGVLAVIVLAGGDNARRLEIIEAIVSYDKDPDMFEFIRLAKILFAGDEPDVISDDEAMPGVIVPRMAA